MNISTRVTCVTFVLLFQKEYKVAKTETTHFMIKHFEGIIQKNRHIFIMRVCNQHFCECCAVR